LLAVYWFLHFQYNGWFLFTCMGLLFYQLHKAGMTNPVFNSIFRLFAIACVPTYFLSALWLHIPLWMDAIVVAAALMQVVAWGMFVKQIGTVKKVLLSAADKLTAGLLLLSALAFSIKLLLQLGSTIPTLSNLAFGFRPVVIGYLHLVLLGVITLFIMGYCFLTKIIIPGNMNIKGVLIFTGGVILNEALLMLQGVTSIGYTVVPYCNEALLGAAIIMFTGLLFLNLQKTVLVK